MSVRTTATIADANDWYVEGLPAAVDFSSTATYPEIRDEANDATYLDWPENGFTVDHDPSETETVHAKISEWAKNVSYEMTIVTSEIPAAA
jgi:hypothetical protein